MAYTEKFQALADEAQSRVSGVSAHEVEGLVNEGALLLDIRASEEHQADHITGSINVSRGKLEMNIEAAVPDLNATILCYCNANNRGALSADTLRAMGYKNARYIAGGLRAYRAME